MAERKLIAIEVAYIDESEQYLISLKVPLGTTIEQAVHLTVLKSKCPTATLQKNAVGIFGQIQPLDTVVKAGDRIEIYRPLKIDPKVARRSKAKKN